MNLNTEPWLQDPRAQAVFTMLEAAGYKALAVGGCVRNALFGLPVQDVDISTDALPDRVIELAKAAGLKAIPTGIDHGTITVVSGGEPYEITTFRKDIETDGRRAVVAFSTDIEHDAKRRDFTMNALYVDARGALQDPLNGLADLQARRLRFIDNAFERIAEDYLRILRYFRFYALYCDPMQGPDMEALAAISANLDGLETLSAERVGAEMRKLLGAANPAPALAMMAQTGVLTRVLPGADPQFLAPLIEAEAGAPVRWLRRLAVLGGEAVQSRLRLSNSEARQLRYIHKSMEFPSLTEAGYRLGNHAATDALLVQCASLGQMPEPKVLAAITEAATAVFPLSAADLMPAIPAGPALGAEIKRLENLWIASGFTLDKAALDKLSNP